MPAGVFNARSVRSSDGVKPKLDELSTLKIQPPKNHQVPIFRSGAPLLELRDKFPDRVNAKLQTMQAQLRLCSESRLWVAIFFGDWSFVGFGAFGYKPIGCLASKPRGGR